MVKKLLGRIDITQSAKRWIRLGKVNSIWAFSLRTQVRGLEVQRDISPGLILAFWIEFDSSANEP